MSSNSRHVLVMAMAVCTMLVWACPARSQAEEGKPHKVWSAASLFAGGGFNFAEGLGRGPAGVGPIAGGLVYFYVTPSLKIGGIATAGIVEETIDGNLFSGGFSGCGPMVSHETSLGRRWSLSFDFGLLFGYVGVNSDSNASGSGRGLLESQPDRSVGSYATGYVASAQLDWTLFKRLRAGIRAQTLVATDAGINGVDFVSPGVGLVLSFGGGRGYLTDSRAKKPTAEPTTKKEPPTEKQTWPISLNDSPRMGDNDKVVILVYSDFQCPFCGKADVAIRETMKKLEGKASLVFKHFPLPYHTRAQEAAEASMAAHMQGKFWEYSELLFANPRALEDEDLLAYAQQVGLDVEQFKKDIKGGQPYRWILRDMAQAKKVNLRGTPTIMINGADYGGSRDPELMARYILENYVNK